MYLRTPILALLLMVLGLNGCASNYRLVKTTQLDLAQQCSTTQALNQQQLLEQQQQLALSLEEILSQLSVKPAPASEPLQCPEPPYTAPPSVNASKQSRDLSSKQLVGAVEQLRFDGVGVTMSARIDTGIATAVLDAREIQPFERNGESWIRFTVQPAEGEPQQIERKLTRMASLPAAVGGGKKRPVVNMRFTLGRVTQHGEFILLDRSANEYPILLGRLALRDVMIVDVSRNNLAPPPYTPDETL